MVRYDTKRDFGAPESETRREYNMRFGQPPGPEAQPPVVVGHVWSWFWKIASRRQSGTGTGQPISFAEITHWSDLTATEVRPVEVEMLLAMDNAFLEAESKERARVKQLQDSRASLIPAAKRLR